jgi:hypothetical protein
MPDENEKQSAEIIQGPWKELKRKIKLPDKSAIELQKTINFVDDLTESLIIQMIHTIKENKIDVEKESFVQNMSLIIEMVRATLLKEMSLNTNMIKIMDILFEIIFNSDCELKSNIDNLKLTMDKIKEEEDNDSPELA